MKGNIMVRASMPMLVLVTVLSWLLFPILLKFMAPLLFKALFLLVLSVVFLMHWEYKQVNQFEFSKEQKVFFFCWGGYLLALMLSTINADDLYAYKQFASDFLKVMFFFFLLRFIDMYYIRKTFSIYANLMVISVIAAVLVSIGVAMGTLEPLTTFRNEINTESHYLFDVYWGAYYRLSPIYAPFPMFRLQGFAEEPGTFAFVLLPALFWMLIVKKAMFRSIVLAVGILGTYSIGAVLALGTMLPFLLRVRSFKSIESLFVAGLISLFVLMCAIPVQTGVPLFAWLNQSYVSIENAFNATGRLVNSDGHLVDADGNLVDAGSYAAYAWSKGFIENKTPSLTQRRDAVLIVLKYLRDHPVGTGAGLGMTTVNYAIAVGYANAALESGVVGGIFYALMFLSLTWFAIKMIWSSSAPTEDNKVRIAIGLSVLTCILMGMQRQQPDISFWHMWIYAALIYLTLKPRSEAPSAA